MNAVTDVLVDLIDPHPQNPRRDVGDVTELAQSIEAQGIRQNLLLVVHPEIPGRYRAVIGHRRLAAAKAAGLLQVPAVVDELTAAEQLELMLVENLQRTDLSPVEEAKGYQDMLDLGVRVRAIAQRTGRAEKVVTGRLKLLKLPWQAQEKVHQHEATLADAVALEEFADDPKVTAKLIKALGTTNFRWEVEQARRDRKVAAEQAERIAELEAAGVTKYTGKKPAQSYNDPDGYRRWFDGAPYPEGAVWIQYSYGVSICYPAPDDDRSKRDAEVAERRRQDEEQRKAAGALAGTAYKLRSTFIDELSLKLTARHKDAIAEAMSEVLVSHWAYLSFANERASVEDWDEISAHDRLILVLHDHWDAAPRVWLQLGKATEEGAAFRSWYRCLEVLGYQLSEAERSAVEAGERADVDEDVVDEDVVDAEVIDDEG